MSIGRGGGGGGGTLPGWPGLMPDFKAHLDTVRLVGQVGYHVAAERLRRRPITALQDVPPSPEKLTTNG